MPLIQVKLLTIDVTLIYYFKFDVKLHHKDVLNFLNDLEGKKRELHVATSREEFKNTTVQELRQKWTL